MNKNNDISALFKQFKGDADGYQELIQEAQTEAARARWPLISTVSATMSQVPPACVVGATGLEVAPIMAERIMPARLAANAPETATVPGPRPSLFSNWIRLMAGSSRQVRA